MTLNLKLNLRKGFSLPSTLQHLLLVVHGEELTLISCTKDSAFISFEMFRDLYTYTLRYHRNVLFIMICVELNEANAKSTDRFSHTYFQNHTREWNQLDESIKISPIASVLKRELIRLTREVTSVVPKNPGTYLKLRPKHPGTRNTRLCL